MKHRYFKGSRGISVNSRIACFTYWVPCQPELHSETVWKSKTTKSGTLVECTLWDASSHFQELGSTFPTSRNLFHTEVWWLLHTFLYGITYERKLEATEVCALLGERTIRKLWKSFFHGIFLIWGNNTNFLFLFYLFSSHLLHPAASSPSSLPSSSHPAPCSPDPLLLLSLQKRVRISQTENAAEAYPWYMHGYWSQNRDTVNPSADFKE